MTLNRTITFLLVCAPFVIFRSPSLGVAGDILSSMVGLNGLDSSAALSALLPVRFALIIAALLVFVNLAPNTWQIRIKPRVWYGHGDRHRGRRGGDDHLAARTPSSTSSSEVRAMRRRQSIAALLAVALGLGSPRLPAPVCAAGPTDRSVKLDLIAKLKQGPEILILGDSRGRQAEPSLLQRLTGHTGFNAAVTGGSAPDAWVFTRYTADRFPGQKRRYIWFVSCRADHQHRRPRLEADPRGRRYLQEVAPYLSTQTVNPPWHTDTHYRPDGSLPGEQSPPSPAQVKRVKAKAARIVAQIRQHPPVAPPFDPTRVQLFEHLLAYMNARGERPVIVFNPIYPTVLAELEKYGDPLSTSSLDYLHSLQPRYDFVVVDCQDIHKWGGTDYDWTNATHVDRANMRRMLRYIVTHSDGALNSARTPAQRRHPNSSPTS